MLEPVDSENSIKIGTLILSVIGLVILAMATLDIHTFYNPTHKYKDSKDKDKKKQKKSKSKKKKKKKKTKPKKDDPANTDGEITGNNE